MRHFATILTIVLAACGHDAYMGPVNLVSAYGPVPLDTYFTTYVRVAEGSRVPAGVTDLEARCEDPSICKAVVRPQQRWPIVDVVGVAPGTTTLAMTYTHPGRKVVERHRASITIAPAAPRPSLVIGAPPPAAAEIDIAALGERPAGRCTPNDPSFLETIAASEDVRVFSCHRNRAVDGGVARPRAPCVDMCPDSGAVESYFTLCATLRDRAIVTIETLVDSSAPGGARRYRELHVEGARAGETACSKPRP